MDEDRKDPCGECGGESLSEMAERGVGESAWLAAVRGEYQSDRRLSWEAVAGGALPVGSRLVYQDRESRSVVVPAGDLSLLARAMVYLDCCGSTNPAGREIHGEAMDADVGLLESAGMDLTSVRKLNESVSYYSDLVDIDADTLCEIDRLTMRMLGDVIGSYDGLSDWRSLSRAVGLLYGWTLFGKED